MLRISVRLSFERSLIIALGLVAVLSFYQPFFQFFTSIPLEYSETGLIKQKVERLLVVNQSGNDHSFQLACRFNACFISNAGCAQRRTSLLRLAPGEALFYDQIVHSPLLIMGPIEGLVLVFKACLWLSIALTAPIWGWVWLQFILPGIKAQERAVLIPFLLFSLICMACGCSFAYLITLPLANEYLSLFNSSIGQNAWTLNHYVNYVLFLFLGHAIAAELALLLFCSRAFSVIVP